MRARYRLVLGSALVPILVSAFLFAGQSPSTGSGIIKNKVIAHQLAVELGNAKAYPHQAHLSSGIMYAAGQATGVFDARAAQFKGAGPALGASTLNTQGCSLAVAKGGRQNVKVNQDCSFRRQAEEVVAVNPTNPKNIIVGQNDSRVGYNQCGFDWSFDGGKSWGDQIPPFHQVILPNGHVGDFCSDPTVGFDSSGNAYAAALELSIDGLASAIVVGKSNAPIGGAFYHSPDSSLGSLQTFYDTPMGVINAQYDPSGCTTNDKELMAVDSESGSSKNGNVYMTWTFFNGCTGEGVGFNSPIYFSQSTDGGLTWSGAIEISGANTTYCTAFSGETDPNACDQDQGSHPVVGPDGTLYVGFGNGNTPTLGINQHMAVTCPASADCSLAASWTAPVKIADDFGLQPLASTVTKSGCPIGRQCLPPNGYRMDDFVEGSMAVDNSGTLYFTWADGRNLGANCQGDYAAASSPCNNDVFFASSTNGGASWSAPTNVTPTSVDGDTAQWMPWSAVTPSGDDLFVAYYDRSFGNCESSGCNDITLATVADPTGAKAISYRRLTATSMPNLKLTNNPIQAGFLGDYMWVTTDSSGNPYIAWADTHGRGGTVEENIYFSK
ncbi:MAG: exo-alpha-sialidase [Actinobacteria bacterium]|nr:MAG: exo-alpha-sialidase [Actinomycetota bacterium]